MKSGAWTPCFSCGFKATGAEELARSLMVSDNCIGGDTLEQIAARRRQGEPWNFDQQLVELFKQRLAAMIQLTPEGRPPAPKGKSPGAEK
jgi:hypothetical protein